MTVAARRRKNRALRDMRHKLRELEYERESSVQTANALRYELSRTRRAWIFKLDRDELKHARRALLSEVARCIAEQVMSDKRMMAYAIDAIDSDMPPTLARLFNLESGEAFNKAVEFVVSEGLLSKDLILEIRAERFTLGTLVKVAPVRSFEDAPETIDRTVVSVNVEKAFKDRQHKNERSL